MWIMMNVNRLIDDFENQPKPVANTAAPTTEEPESEAGWDDDEEFARLLNKFLNEDMEVVDETADDISIPDGEIEQNQNISVKVEILRPIANPREELNKLVGCSDIKRRMDELVALTSYNKMMHELFPNGKQHEVSLHSVFLGRPGTGKTTVCKIFGSLLRQAGALSKGHVVVCDRGTFIGTLWGDEERSMKQVLEMAKGGVLMIDEAYLLNGKHDNDPGKLVIQLMMNILADETQRDIAIVLCGYKEPMMKLLDTNPGLQSRFPNKFEFTDFTVDELLEITRRRIKDYDSTISSLPRPGRNTVACSHRLTRCATLRRGAMPASSPTSWSVSISSTQPVVSSDVPRTNANCCCSPPRTSCP